MLDLYGCFGLFIREKYPNLRLLKFHDGIFTQIRINRENGRSIIAVHEEFPGEIYYAAEGIRTPPLGVPGPNQAWYLVKTHLGDPQYFDLVSQAIDIVQGIRKGMYEL